MFLTNVLVLTRLSLVHCTPPDTDSLFSEPFPEVKTMSLSLSSQSHPESLLSELVLKHTFWNLSQILGAAAEILQSPVLRVSLP